MCEERKKKTDYAIWAASVAATIAAAASLYIYWDGSTKLRKAEAIKAQCEMIARINAAKAVIDDADKLSGTKDNTQLGDWVRIAENLMLAGESTTNRTGLADDWYKILGSMSSGGLITDEKFRNAGAAFGKMAGVAEERTKFQPSKALLDVSNEINRIESAVPKL